MFIDTLATNDWLTPSPVKSSTTAVKFTKVFFALEKIPLTPLMNFLKSTCHSARFMQRRVTLNSLRYTNRARLYSTATGGPVKESSNVPWAIGSLLVFGPILFKLTSPPPPSKRKNLTEHLAPVPVEEEKPAAVEEPVKVIQKPYVLIGAGTASFAAAQAIKEKDPNANVTIESDILCVYSTVFAQLGHHHW